MEADLSCGGDRASGDPHGVDASAGVLVDFDVGLLLSVLDVSLRVKQVQHLLVVQLEIKQNTSLIDDADYCMNSDVIILTSCQL